MAITVLPPRQTGGQAFSEAMQPYLQMAMQAMLQKSLKSGEEKRAEEKEKREAISGVSKGEYPITAIPESIRSQILKPSVDVAFGTPEWSQKAQQMMGQGVVATPESGALQIPETPEMAQARLMSSYATQQQAINPYKALQAETLGAKQQINSLLEAGTPWESIPVQLKIMAGFAAKEGGGMNINIPGFNQAQQSIPKYDPKREKLQYNSDTGEYRTVPK